MFISSALASTETAAAATGAQGAAGMLVSFAPLLLVFVIFWLFLVRPQNKRMQEFQRLISNLRRGDRVVTTGGLIGTVTKVENNSPDLMLEIAEGVRVRVQRSAIAEILAKTTETSTEASA